MLFRSNPLTTLLQSFLDARGGSLSAAQSKILANLGLPAGLDLRSFDPIAAAQSSVPATRADGLKAQAIAAQIDQIERWRHRLTQEHQRAPGQYNGQRETAQNRLELH